MSKKKQQKKLLKLIKKEWDSYGPKTPELMWMVADNYTPFLPNPYLFDTNSVPRILQPKSLDWWDSFRKGK